MISDSQVREARAVEDSCQSHRVSKFRKRAGFYFIINGKLLNPFRQGSRLNVFVGEALEERSRKGPRDTWR